MAPKAKTFAKKRKTSSRAFSSQELKFFDDTVANTDVTIGGVIVQDSINEIPQNVTSSGRIGRKVTVKSVHLKGMVTLRQSNSGSLSSNRFRMIIYHDKQANGATAAVLDILKTTTIDSFRNLNNVSRFRILHDQTFAMNSMAAEGNAAVNIVERIYNLNINKDVSIPLEFSGAAGGITELTSGNIGVLCIASEVTTNTSQVRFTTRVRFSDS